VAFVYLLWISVFVIAQMLLTNTIEEKSNKIMEVLLSSVSPIQLMAGKIVGIAGTGLTMVVSWVVFFLASVKVMPLLLDQLPDIDFALIARDPIYIASFLAYFILGYLFLAAVLVGIGSVCSSLKEAQNLMGPVTIIMIIPLLAMVPIGQDPNGTIAKVLSYIPPFTPFVMMNRAAGPPAPMEYVVTTILLVVSIAIALWAAAKLFRIGILMTGKPPKPMEILRWIRAPVGQVHVRREE
jgi:ABC-type Na+ efflux pump permease subunit